MKKYVAILVSLLSALLLCLAWPVSPLTMLIFVAWIPLLWLEHNIESRKKFFWLTYLVMFVWNVGTTWWIWNASAAGAIAAFFANSLLMCLPWVGFKIVKKRLGNFFGYASLLVFWMCFEYIHLHDWGLSWPWLTLGNVFATQLSWIQWYEYTGTSGGTLWILIVNILLFVHFKNALDSSRKKNYHHLVCALLILAIPYFISTLIAKNISSPLLPEGRANIVVVQPNIDPYLKVSQATGSFEDQLAKLIATSEQQINDSTKLLVWPETAMYNATGINEATLKDNYFLNPLWSFLQKHPHLQLFTGIESFRPFDEKTKFSTEINGRFYESYNAAVLLDSSGAHGFYHKSMLVPGVETLPWFLRFIASWFEKFGGTTAGYARQDERTVITSGNYKIAPAICYESVYGEFMSRYIRNGANLIAIITNDGWWKNTPGHKQHMNYARLRAIETRTWVARSANTGISCFINPRGIVINPRPYNSSAAIRLSFEPAQTKTFYVRYGDILSKIAVVITMALLVFYAVMKVRKRNW